ncbi:Cysteine protease atg4 [Basidiobolus ranarum]|uniref:Cysteine protease n=1 Tax=Basidiobolus ranarum TaxID=34480 RepID=A0ABR2W5X1_9FUNG
METYNSEHSTKDSSQNNPHTASNLLLFNEPKRSLEGDTSDGKPVQLQDTLKQVEPHFSDEELFDIEDLGTSVLTKTNIPTEQTTPDSLFRLSDRSLYQAGHNTLKRIQGAAEVASNRITDWIKPLIPSKLAGTGPEDRTIYMLGTTYSFTLTELAEIKEKYPLEFIEDFKSRLWFTYRTGFTPIQPSDYVSDVGWGCMLRSAQMLLGQALVMLKLGREWRKNSTSVESQRIYAQIVDLFLDDLTTHTPFSLHNFCTQGRQLGKNIGEWFGPVTASQAIKGLVNSYETLNLGVYVATDGVIYKDQLRMLTQDSQGSHKPLLVLLPTRLGINTLNPIYFPAIK